MVIKTLKPDSSETDASDLDRELGILQLLRHPNIVELVGAGIAPQVNRIRTVLLLSELPVYLTDKDIEHILIAIVVIADCVECSVEYYTVVHYCIIQCCITYSVYIGL